jgi:thiamine pyrophosphate-dependent acetolactate synthase large subunit-like protein
MKRIEALRIVDSAFADAPLVSTVGATSRELASLARRPSHLYLLDSMGLATAVAAGLALGLDRPVAVVEGDGSLLMGFSILPTLAFHRPPHLVVIVLDNHQHASAACLPTQAAEVSLEPFCRATGLPTVRVATPDELVAALASARASDGPEIVLVDIEPGNSSGVPFLLDDPVAIVNRFTAFLNGGNT